MSSELHGVQAILSDRATPILCSGSGALGLAQALHIQCILRAFPNGAGVQLETECEAVSTWVKSLSQSQSFPRSQQGPLHALLLASSAHFILSLSLPTHCLSPALKNISSLLAISM